MCENSNIFCFTPCKFALLELYSPVAEAWCASLAQLVEQLICNHQVAGSSPTAGSIPLRVAVCAAEPIAAGHKEADALLKL